MLSSSAGGKSVRVHQQDDWGMPVLRSISIAHWFASPQSGQWVATEAMDEDMLAV
ncbi:hypothetical protein [Polaromonas sp.]|uniref:hypothetical protein n=1 Tax=Polaromonas sp. TaxID=1869339 RepID=UPI002D77E7E6|nr:hypothetical protein [Polaromonas sp.]